MPPDQHHLSAQYIVLLPHCSSGTASGQFLRLAASPNPAVFSISKPNFLKQPFFSEEVTKTFLTLVPTTLPFLLKTCA